MRRPHLRCDRPPSAVQWRTDRADVASQVGPMPRESASNQSTQAVADDSDLASRILRDVFQAGQYALDFALRASDIEIDSREMGAIADLLKPSRHRGERPVAGGEAGNQQNRFVFAFGNALSMKDGIQKKS